MCCAFINPDALHLLLLPVIGVVAGLLGGLLGIGGGIVMIPAMLLLLPEDLYGGRDQRLHVFQLAALATAVVLSAPAAKRHAQARAIVPAMLWGIIPAAVIGVVGGVTLASLFVGEHAHLLRRIFGAFMVLAAAADIWWHRAAQPRHETHRLSCPVATRRALIGTAVGLPAGVIGGLLGVGGGIWAVPTQNAAFGIRLPNAIANSACTIVAAAAAAALAKSVAIMRIAELDVLNGWWLALWLAPGALVGGWFGAALTHRLPVRWIRRAFYALLVITGLRLALGDMGSVIWG
jgi:uncharacterized membrane protein YfcA